MTKKDYELIAEVLNSGVMAYSKKEQVCNKFIEALTRDNPRFNKDIFSKACGLVDDRISRDCMNCGDTFSTTNKDNHVYCIFCR